VQDLRTFSQDYFLNELFYEQNMVMTLHKVRETIINDQKNPNPLPYEREFDLVVKIDEMITEPLSQSETDEMLSINMTDTTNLIYQVSVPLKLMPANVVVGDVIRINKLK